jgi:hypothetical protein
MKTEMLIKRMNEKRKVMLKQIAWRIFEAALAWSDCAECVEVKRNAIAAIRLVRSLR